MRARALRARPRRRGLPKDHGERHPRSMPSNILDRQFAATVDGHSAKPEMGGRFHLCLDGRGLALCRRGDRPVLAPCRRLVDEQQHDRAVGGRRAGHGDLAAWQAPSGAPSLRPRQPGRIQSVVLDRCYQRLPIYAGENGRLAAAMAVDQAAGSVRVQFQDPVANDLHRHARYRCSFGARGPVIKSREGHQSPGLPCMLAAPGDATKARGGVLVRKRDAHGDLINARAIDQITPRRERPASHARRVLL